MKKIIPIIIIVTLIFSVKNENAITIPTEALRFRVIANSNSRADEEIKTRVKEDLEKELYTYLNGVESVGEARDILKDKLLFMENRVATTLRNNKVKYGHSIDLGLNQFPHKEFRGIIYEEGEYESLVVRLGRGEGSNWWCVLFPPLCLLEANESELETVEYQLFVRKILDKFFK